MIKLPVLGSIFSLILLVLIARLVHGWAETKSDSLFLQYQEHGQREKKIFVEETYVYEEGFWGPYFIAMVKKGWLKFSLICLDYYC